MLLVDAITASQNSKAVLTLGEQTILYQLAEKVPVGGAAIVELGSWMGGSTIMLAVVA